MCFFFLKKETSFEQNSRNLQSSLNLHFQGLLLTFYWMKPKIIFTKFRHVDTHVYVYINHSWQQFEMKALDDILSKNKQCMLWDYAL